MRAFLVVVVVAGLLGCKHTPRGKDPVPPETPPHSGPTTLLLSARLNTTCVQDAKGVVCWGGVNGEPGKPPTSVGLRPGQELAVNWRDACGLDAGQVHCTESAGGGLDAKLPAGATQLGVAGESACAVSGGRVLCWGDGAAGMLGDGTVAHAQPAAVPGIDGVQSLAVGRESVCAVDGSGRVLCWGAASWSGHLGPGIDCKESYTPEQHLPPGAVGEAPSALRLVGAVAPIVYCSKPTAVAGVSDAVAVSVGRGGRACVITRARTVRCWGDTVVDVPGLTGVVEVATSDDHACARLEGGTVSCWGSNELGELGNGTTTNSDAPVPVSGLDHVIRLALGIQHSCALRDDGGVRCWGGNASGQLGDGTTENRSTPVAVKR